MAKRKWHMAKSKGEMAKDKWHMANGNRKMANGKWHMANVKWQMAHGKWQMLNGKWQMAMTISMAILHESSSKSSCTLSSTQPTSKLNGR